MTTAKAVIQVTEDPHLQELACHVVRLSRMEEGRDPGAPCRKVSTKASPGKGIGLRYVIRPIRALDWARENPLPAAAIAVGSIGALVWIGYLIGEGR